MKKWNLILFLPFLYILSACNSPSGGESPTAFGNKVDTMGYIPVDELMADKASLENGINCKVSGTVSDVCQAEGCWLKLRQSEGADLLVRMKEHTFTVPKNIAGKSVIVEGFAHFDTTSVELLKDYAKDEGKSAEEIAAITEPKVEAVIEAVGVVIR